MVLLDTGNPGTSREIYSEDADGETRTRNPSVINRLYFYCCLTRLKLKMCRINFVDNLTAAFDTFDYTAYET